MVYLTQSRCFREAGYGVKVTQFNMKGISANSAGEFKHGFIPASCETSDLGVEPAWMFTL